VLFTKDNSFGMQRIEGCGRCDGHLGHLWRRSSPTGKKILHEFYRALTFIPDDK
jgi:peptide methionine sulfoxide reductase MsrB